MNKSKVEFFRMAKGLLKDVGNHTMKRNSRPLAFNINSSKNNNSVDSIEHNDLMDPLNMKLKSKSGKFSKTMHPSMNKKSYNIYESVPVSSSKESSVSSIRILKANAHSSAERSCTEITKNQESILNESVQKPLTNRQVCMQNFYNSRKIK